jgi:hypothetical protein
MQPKLPQLLLLVLTLFFTSASAAPSPVADRPIIKRIIEERKVDISMSILAPISASALNVNLPIPLV